MRRLNLIVCLLLLLSSGPIVVYAQDKGKDEGLSVFLHPKKFYKKYFPGLRIKKPKYDTAFLKSYPNFLTTGVHLILPATDVDIRPQLHNESDGRAASKFRTNVGTIVALSVGYRFISAGFAMVLSPASNSKQDYATTRYRTATIKYNNAAYYLQFKYLRIKGFTDANTLNWSDSQVPLRRADIRLKEFQFEGMYNFNWKRYSLYAPLDYTQRQIKTSIGPLIKGGVYYNEMAADSNFITVNQQAQFENFDNIVKIRSTSFKLAPGIGANVVFLRRFYLAAAVFAPYNLYVYNLFTEENQRVRKGTSLALVLDGNISVGFQSERFYAGVRYLADSKRVRLNSVEMNTMFSYVGFDVGYRFNTPSLVKKVYKDTMPPGM